MKDLDSAVIYTHNVTDSVAFYKNELGLKLDFQDGERFAQFGFPSGKKLSIKKRSNELEHPGKQAFFLRVDSIEHLYDSFKVKNTKILKELKEETWAKNFSVLDPDGNKIQFVQRLEPQYLSIKVSVIVILMRGKQVFLFKRKNTGWADGDYTVPSGHVDFGETPIESAIREAKEEAGVQIKKTDLEMIHSDFISGEVINFTFIAKNWTGEPKVMEEDKAKDGEWFDLDNLPTNIAGHGKTILENLKNNVIYHEIK